jgi:hypothetical protein
MVPTGRHPVGDGVERILPVLAMTCGYSRITDAVMIPFRKAGDILAGMWEIIDDWGPLPTQPGRDREAAIGGTGRLTMEAAAFAGTRRRHGPISALRACLVWILLLMVHDHRSWRMRCRGGWCRMSCGRWSSR